MFVQRIDLFFYKGNQGKICTQYQLLAKQSVFHFQFFSSTFVFIEPKYYILINKQCMNCISTDALVSQSVISFMLHKRQLFPFFFNYFVDPYRALLVGQLQWRQQAWCEIWGVTGSKRPQDGTGTRGQICKDITSVHVMPALPAELIGTSPFPFLTP